MATIGELSVLLSLKGISQFKSGLKQVEDSLENVGKISKEDTEIISAFDSALGKALSENERAAKKFEASIGRLGNEITRFGKNVDQVIRPLGQLGVAITGIFSASFLAASKELPAVDSGLKQIKNSFEEMSKSIAQAALPSLKEFSQFLIVASNTLKAFAQQHPEVINGILKLGVALLALKGASTIFKILTASIGALVKILFTLGAALGIANSQILLFAGLFLAAAAAVIVLRDALNDIPKAIKNFATGGFFNLGAAFGAKKGNDIFGDFFKALDKLKNATNQTLEETTDLFGRFARGVQSQFQDLSTNMEGFGKDIAQSLDSAFGDTIFNAITGRIRGLRSVLISFAEDVGRAFSRRLSNTLLGFILGDAQGNQGLLGKAGLGSVANFITGRKQARQNKAAGGAGGGADGSGVDALNQQLTGTAANFQKLQDAKDMVIGGFDSLTSSISNVTGGIGEAIAAGFPGIGAIGEDVLASFDALIQKIGILKIGFDLVKASVTAIGNEFLKNAAKFVISTTIMTVASLAALAISVIAGIAAAAALTAAWTPAATAAAIATLGGALVFGAAAIGMIGSSSSAVGAIGGGLPKGAGISFGGGAGEGGDVGKIIGGGGGMPKFAQGGIVTKPTVALIGEAGPEAIVPLGEGGFGGNTIIMNFQDPTFFDDDTTLNKIAKALSPSLIRETERRSGGTTIRL